ncbi:TIGR03915 family putative DNA repair protein [Daejeonella oryzae]|uniref:TIGR03915 family putative DNA repair protein n=1 Tax=Daejeonella oryzae TaxID=1122943 RepID=UPI00040EA681|nr:TIGR03915 family putative DNA repair protein [Daejeonella oryzae]
MAITTIIYDGSWEGLLTIVFEVYDRKLSDFRVYRISESQPALFGETLLINIDQSKALRVWDGLKKKLNGPACRNLFSCYLSELKGVEDLLIEFIQLVFSSVGSVEKSFTNPCVLRLSQIGKMVHREKHRMEAFVRFKLTKDEIYYAAIEPDYNVIPLILNHFKNRYADQKWLIYDLKRGYGIYYDLNFVEEITLDKKPHINPESNLLEDSEILYQNLWKDYFENANIKSRKNTSLHLKHVPVRYWKYLIEKN